VIEMKRNTLLAAMTLAATAFGGAAFADANHGHGGQLGAQGGAGMMQMFDTDGDGTTTPEEMRTRLQAKLSEFDSDGDGNLSITEFEALHSAMIREMMVDRFQHLDADGDGAVTPEEMAAPADRMERMQMMRSNMADAPARPGNGQGMGNGSMMEDN
jgi:Ca2+-binding EF-hand superfamily protein